MEDSKPTVQEGEAHINLKVIGTKSTIASRGLFLQKSLNIYIVENRSERPLSIRLKFILIFTITKETLSMFKY